MKNLKIMLSGFLTIYLLSVMPAMAMTLSQGSNGQLEQGAYVFSSASTGAFSDNYNFSLGETFNTKSGLTGLSVSLPGGKAGEMLGGAGPSSISGLEFSLFEAGSSTPLGRQLTAGPASMISAQLPAGDYRFNVRGDSGGKYAGALKLVPFVTPVPEASTWIMMIFGVGFVAFLLKNKNVVRRERLTMGSALPA